MNTWTDSEDFILVHIHTYFLHTFGCVMDMHDMYVHGICVHAYAPMLRVERKTSDVLPWPSYYFEIGLLTEAGMRLVAGKLQ